MASAPELSREQKRSGIWLLVASLAATSVIYGAAIEAMFLMPANLPFWMMLTPVPVAIVLSRIVRRSIDRRLQQVFEGPADGHS